MLRDHRAKLSMCVCAHSEHKSGNPALNFSGLFDRALGIGPEIWRQNGIRLIAFQI